MHRLKRLTALVLTVLTLSGVCVFGTSISASASGTGAGLAEWALNAYYSGWSYVYGGSSAGAVDCSGLIYSYCGGDRVGSAQLASATESGSVSSGIPRVHGLGLYMPGHVGVYIGDGMEVDARNESAGVCYQSVESSYMGWSTWFRLAAVSYVYNGWEEFNGNYYYYEDGQYIVDTSRTINGVTYYFDSTGISSETPSDTSSKADSASSSDSSSDTSSESSKSAESSSSDSKSESSKTEIWQNGSEGEEVEKIQTRLTELGFYTGEISGVFGDATEEAYRAFQEAAGLTVDGIAGSDREILYSDDAPYADTEEEKDTQEDAEDTEKAEETEESAEVTYQSGCEGDEVYDIQAQLASLGYFGIDPTGYYGEITAEAVAYFQAANNLEATGIVDEATYALLFSEDAVGNPNPSAAEITTGNEAGPVELSASSEISDYVITNEQNEEYAETAVTVAAKTNKVTKKALSDSADVIPAATTAEVTRSAGIWLWFVLAATALCAMAFVFIIRDRKATRYERYLAKKQKSR